MEITILGTRGEIAASAPQHEKHSGILIDKKILLDLGEEEFLHYHPKLIFITHLHPDHAFFVRDKRDIKKLTQLYLPEPYLSDTQILTSAKKFGAYEIIPIPTSHSLKVKSQAYLIKKAHKKILYTGDLISIDQKCCSRLKNLDLVITEASYIRTGGLIKKHKETGLHYGHNGIPDLLKLFSQFTKKIVFVHFGTWFFKNIPKAKTKIEALAKLYNVNVDIGYDGMSIQV